MGKIFSTGELVAMLTCEGEEEKRRMKEHSKVSFARYDMKTCAANYERLMIQLCRTKNRQ